MSFRSQPENLDTSPIYKLSDVVVPTIPIIPKHGFWSGNNQLGFETDFAPDVNNEQTILKLDEWGPPEIWTVTLYSVFRIDAIPVGGFVIAGNITIGSGGTSLFLENMDWNQTFSAPMNAINCVAKYQTAPSANAGLRVGVILARGTIGKREASDQFQAFSLAAGASSGVFFMRPHFRSVQVIPTTGPGAGITTANVARVYSPENLVVFSTDVGQTVLSAVYRGSDIPNYPEGFPIPNGTNFVQYRNLDATSPGFCSGTFTGRFPF